MTGWVPPRRIPTRRRGRFIGRGDELGTLLDAYERIQDGEGSVYTVVGEAGAGKSRLFSELYERVGEGVLWMEGRAYGHTSIIPYAPRHRSLHAGDPARRRDPRSTISASG